MGWTRSSRHEEGGATSTEVRSTGKKAIARAREPRKRVRRGRESGKNAGKAVSLTSFFPGGTTKKEQGGASARQGLASRKGLGGRIPKDVP